MNLPSHFASVGRVKWGALIGVALAGLAWNELQAADLAGTVVDARSGQPVAGAYVLAVYKESGGTWFGHSGSWCVRTAGMRTAPDGRFALPAGSSNHVELHVIKEGFIETSSPELPEARYWWQSERAKRLYVEPLVTKGKRSRFIQCERPASRADVEANIAYLRLLEKEDDFNEVAEPTRSIPQRVIARFEKLK